MSPDPELPSNSGPTSDAAGGARQGPGSTPTPSPAPRPSPTPRSGPSPAMRWLSVIAMIVTGLTVALGSMVCALDASAACPNWPGCYTGSVLPSGELPPLLEFTHRVIAILTTPAILATALLGRRSRRWRLRLLPWISLGCALAAGTFGMMIIKFTLPMPLAVLDLSLSLVALAATTATAYAAFRPSDDGARPLPLLAYATLGVLLVAHALGIVVAGDGEYVRCMSWPTELMPAGAGPLDMVRIGMFALTVIGLLAVAVLTIAVQCRVVPETWAALGSLVPVATLAAVMGGGAGPGFLAAFSVLAVIVVWLTAAAAARLSGPAGRHRPGSRSSSV